MKPSLIMLQTLLLASITALHAAEKAAKPKPDQLAGIDPSDNSSLPPERMV